MKSFQFTLMHTKMNNFDFPAPHMYMVIDLWYIVVFLLLKKYDKMSDKGQTWWMRKKLIEIDKLNETMWGENANQTDLAEHKENEKELEEDLKQNWMWKSLSYYFIQSTNRKLCRKLCDILFCTDWMCAKNQCSFGVNTVVNATDYELSILGSGFIALSVRCSNFQSLFLCVLPNWLIKL